MINREDITSALSKNMSMVTAAEERLNLRQSVAMPNEKELQRLMYTLRNIIFPDFVSTDTSSCNIDHHVMSMMIEEAQVLLHRQIQRSYSFLGKKKKSEKEIAIEVERFMFELPRIKFLLLTDVEAVLQRDPAVEHSSEIVFSYPLVTVMLHQRIAHQLYEQGIPVIPRIITEMAHSATGIDIHPGATIGTHFAIDHGTGVVIGATAIIGNNVMLYQGVTIGAKSIKYDADGTPQNLPRHPIIEDNVTIYSNATILGRITIGHDSVIGGNVWVTSCVPPHTRILQSKPSTDDCFEDGAGI